MPKRSREVKEDVAQPQLKGEPSASSSEDATINVGVIASNGCDKGWRLHVPSSVYKRKLHVVVRVRVKPHQYAVGYPMPNHAHSVKIVQDAQHDDKGTYNQDLDEGEYVQKEDDDDDVCVMRMGVRGGTVHNGDGYVTFVDPMAVRLMGRESIVPDVVDVLRTSDSADDVSGWVHGSTSADKALVKVRTTGDENVFWKWAHEIKHLRRAPETDEASEQE